MDVKELKNKANELLQNYGVSVFEGEETIISELKLMANGEYNEEDLLIKERILTNIEKYLETKSKMLIQERDYEYLKNIAKGLREQKIRIEDQAPFKSPIFHLPIEDDTTESYDFITREGFDKFREVNSTMFKNESADLNNDEERRKDKTYTVEKNRNLQLERILEIISRNY